MMDTRIDQLISQDDIQRLVQGFAFRDERRWPDLAGLFWPGARISVSWFSGPIEEFIERSKALGGGKIGLKHWLSAPRLQVVGSRAVGLTNVCIMLRAPIGADGFLVDITSWARFADRFERRGNEWRILERTAIYEKDRADAVVAGHQIPWTSTPEMAERFPPHYRSLAKLHMELGGAEMPAVVTDGSAEAAKTLEVANTWLHG